MMIADTPIESIDNLPITILIIIQEGFVREPHSSSRITTDTKAFIIEVVVIVVVVFLQHLVILSYVHRILKVHSWLTIYCRIWFHRC